MANLIIKSSANDLVIQGSDESPAITVGATGTTTFAENATLSGTANNLGTVTAGSIAGGSITSATTFPSGTGTATGHVLQSQYGERITTYSTTPTANVWWSPFTTADCVITPISTSNKYFINFSVNSWWMQSNGSTMHPHIRFSYTPSGGSTVYFSEVEYVASTYGYANSVYNIEGLNVLKRIDVPSALATTFSFQLKIDQAVANIFPNGDGLISLTVTEVQA
jgi:hypothetical protein